MHKSLRPSCFKTSESAANRVSFSTRPRANLESIVLETINEHRDPATLADAAINQLVYQSALVNLAKELWWSVLPLRETVDKASDGQTGRVSYNRGKCGQEDQSPDNQPAAGQTLPLYSNGSQPCKNPLIVNKKEYSNSKQSKNCDDC